MQYSERLGVRHLLDVFLEYLMFEQNEIKKLVLV